MMGFAKGSTQPPLARFGLSQSRSVAALAFHHLVALLDQTLAFAIFTLGLLLDVRAFFIGHDGLQGEVRPLDRERRMRVGQLSPRTMAIARRWGNEPWPALQTSRARYG